jgi:hypothetical protein
MNVVDQILLSRRDLWDKVPGGNRLRSLPSGWEAI